ncbi:MAG: hypothetical protein OK438_06520 [Thaumarchaeota archaeon]|nr:hypothetical protein [Nitrososphaerota archaeon]
MKSSGLLRQSEQPARMGRPWPVAPVVATILVIIAWLVFILLYALYWSNGYSLFQNVIVTIVSLVITALLVSVGWVIWGSRHHWDFAEYGWESQHKKE